MYNVALIHMYILFVVSESTFLPIPFPPPAAI
jgi:hypothetical protein